MENQAESGALDNRAITIAIDFGTTFSGAAWHWSENVSNMTDRFYHSML